MEPNDLGIFQVGQGYNLLEALNVRATFTLHHYPCRGAVVATSRIRFLFFLDISRWL
jgi:hypothetical protein